MKKGLQTNKKKTKAVNTKDRSTEETATFSWRLQVDIKDDVIENNVT